MVPEVLLSCSCQSQPSGIRDLGFCTNPRLKPRLVRVFFLVPGKVLLSLSLL